MTPFGPPMVQCTPPPLSEVAAADVDVWMVSSACVCVRDKKYALLRRKNLQIQVCECHSKDTSSSSLLPNNLASPFHPNSLNFP